MFSLTFGYAVSIVLDAHSGLSNTLFWLRPEPGIPGKTSRPRDRVFSLLPSLSGTGSFQSGRYLHAVYGGEFIPAVGITEPNGPDFTPGLKFLSNPEKTKARQTSSGRADLRLSPFRNLPGSSLLHNFVHVPPSMAIAARPLLARKKSGEYNSWVRSSIPDHPPPALGPLHVPPSNGDRRLITRIRREPDESRTANSGTGSAIQFRNQGKPLILRGRR